MNEVVLGALVGAGAAIIGSLLTTGVQLWLDRRRARESREDAIAQEYLAALQQLTIHMAASLHSMCWLTWQARERGDRVSQARLDEYDAEQHQILPEIIGYLSTVAVLNSKVYTQLNRHVRDVFDLDARIAATGLWLDKDNATTVAKLAALFEEVSKKEEELPKIVGDLAGKGFQVPVPVVTRRLA